MGWDDLKAIRQTQRDDAIEQDKEPPVSCPFDGEPLEVRSDGVRNCPWGNFTWHG